MRPTRSALLGLLALTLTLGACDTFAPLEPAPEAGPHTASVPPSRAVTQPVPAQGTSATLDFGTWNIEWFGDTSNGPGDEALQLENVRDIIAGVDMDLWSVQEVTGAAHFEDLVAGLSGYSGFLANDPLVTDGALYYSDFSDNELKVGLLYKTSQTTVESARVILAEYDYDFAGRPPVEVQLSTTIDGVSRSLVVILLHAKAGSGGDDWERRSNAAAALKSYLDTTWPSAHVMVIGDFNDDVDASITRPKDSPYKSFVDDAGAYTFPTKALSDAGVSSTVYYSDMIDHHLASDELIATYVTGSAQVFPADQYVSDYDGTTSDHYPVLTSFTLSGGTNSAPTASFTYSCTELACDFDGSGSSDGDGSITSYAWDFGDGATASDVAASHTYAADGTYTVTLTVTDDAGATGTSLQEVTVAQASSGGITLSATGYKVKGAQKVDLSWSGASSVDVDLYRDGSVVATTPNDGAYTDAIDQRGGGSYVYQLCEAGTSTCSNEATVTF